MNQKLLLGLILILAFLGIADSWYLAESALNGVAPACDVTILSGCEQVSQSPYSKLFGVPLGVYGTLFYSLIFAGAALLTLYRKRRAYVALYLLGIGGFCASLVFVLIQAFLIGSFCIYCMLSAVLSVALFALTRSLFIRFSPPKLAVVG